MPDNRAAWIPSAPGDSLVIRDAPYPSPSPDEIVVASRAVAINPVDWKMQDTGTLITDYPSIFGCDVGGVVEEVGDAVQEIKKGDRVISNAVRLVKGDQYGAFQHFVKCPVNVTCKLPGNLSMEQGCVLPLAVNTAVLGLFSQDNFNLPLPSLEPHLSNKVVFVYGGSTSVGSTAIQLARACGVRVFTTASKRNHEHCKMLGAEKVYDYTDDAWVDQAVDDLKGETIAGVYDTVSHGSTTQMCAQLLSKLGSRAPIVITGPPSDGVASKQVFGANLTLDEKLAEAIWKEFLPHALAAEKILPQPEAQVVGTGLEQIQAAMDMQRKGVSARKLVVKLP